MMGEDEMNLPRIVIIGKGCRLATFGKALWSALSWQDEERDEKGRGGVLKDGEGNSLPPGVTWRGVGSIVTKYYSAKVEIVCVDVSNKGCEVAKGKDNIETNHCSIKDANDASQSTENCVVDGSGGLMDGDRVQATLFFHSVLLDDALSSESSCNATLDKLAGYIMQLDGGKKEQRHQDESDGEKDGDCRENDVGDEDIQENSISPTVDACPIKLVIIEKINKSDSNSIENTAGDNCIHDRFSSDKAFDWCFDHGFEFVEHLVSDCRATSSSSTSCDGPGGYGTSSAPSLTKVVCKCGNADCIVGNTSDSQPERRCSNALSSGVARKGLLSSCGDAACVVGLERVVEALEAHAWPRLQRVDERHQRKSETVGGREHKEELFSRLVTSDVEKKLDGQPGSNKMLNGQVVEDVSDVLYKEAVGDKTRGCISLNKRNVDEEEEFERLMMQMSEFRVANKMSIISDAERRRGAESLIMKLTNLLGNLGDDDESSESETSVDLPCDVHTKGMNEVFLDTTSRTK